MPQSMVRQSKSVTASVVEKIADAEGVGKFDIQPLFESVDPDALEAIFGDPAVAEHITVEFVHAGYHVAIDGGNISVDGHVDDS